MSVCNHLSWVGTGSLSVYTDRSLRGLGTVDCKASPAVYFEDIDLDLDIGVLGLMLSTLAKMQVIALALECVGSGLKFLPYGLLSEINWHWSLLVWHPDLHMAAGYTSKTSANTHTYFMKALHCRLPVAV
ncbi:hypothetical protein G9A89_009243 [Geosiphon pyriformis]|nr:hypothetical protein G9A89_009243 [Geosiphon pyriformis]